MAKASGSSGVDGMSQDTMLDTAGGQFVADLISDFESDTGNVLSLANVQAVNSAIANAATDLGSGSLTTANLRSLISQGFAGTLAPGAG